MDSPGTFDTPAGFAERATIIDDSLSHQIRIVGTQPIFVSCTCRRASSARGAGIGHYRPIASITTCEQAWTVWHDYHPGS